MEQLYDEILIDENVWTSIEGFAKVKHFIENYQYIALATGSSIEDATIYEWLIFLGRITKGETLPEFIKRHQKLGDFPKWIYVSESLQNIGFMQQYMDCCFVNTGYNDCIDISCTHEVRNINDIQKIRK